MIPAIGDQIVIDDATDHPPYRSARLVVTLCREVQRAELPWAGADTPDRFYAVECDVFNRGSTHRVNTLGFSSLEISPSGNLRPIPRPAGQRPTDPFEIVVTHRPQRHQASLF